MGFFFFFFFLEFALFIYREEGPSEVQGTGFVFQGQITMLRLNLGARSLGAHLLRDTSDPYVQSLTLREMAARLKRPVATVDDFCASQSLCVRDWEQQDHEHLAQQLPLLQRALEQHAPQVLRLLQEVEVEVFLTSGAEETGLSSGLKSRIAFCRRDRFIFFSRAYLDWKNQPDLVQHLLLHELWHIVSRNMKQNKLDEVYARFGFHRLETGVLRNSSPHRLSNPDGLLIEHGLNVLGKTFVPVLLISPEYDVLSQTESVFDHMLMLFAPLTKEGTFEGPAYNLESDKLLSESVFNKIGRNTQYLLHIDEVVAENFAMLTRQEECADKRKLEDLREVLKRI